MARTDSTAPEADDAAPVPSITDRFHEGSWSANLEGPEHADDEALVVAQSLDAVAHTAAGTHVNLVTHGDLGHPTGYLHDALRERLDDLAVAIEYVDRCGCGGHVTRVHVEGRGR